MSARRLIAVLLPALAYVLSAWAADAPVTLQLKWQHAFQFAGYYAAEEQGYYREAGLDVTIKAAAPSTDAVDDVVAERAQFGVGTSSLLLERHAGKPVVVLGVVFQHSPYILVARRDGSLQSVHDLVDHRLMLEPLSDEILAYLKREGVPLDRITRQKHSFELDDLIQGRTDAIAAYTTDQPYYLQKAGFPFQVFSPRMGGIDFYGDNLFTSESYLRRFPERVRAFRAASMRGWEYAMAHPEEMVEHIAARYAPHLSREYLRFEAEQMKELVQANLVPVGYMNPGRWKHIAETYAEIGMLPANEPLDGFLYDPDPITDHGWLYRSLAIVAAAAVLVSAVAAHIFRINRRLKDSLASLKGAHDRLQILSTAIEQSSSGVVVTDASTRIQYANPQLYAITGYSAEELVGRPTNVFKSDKTPAATYQGMWTTLRSGQPWHGELLNRTKSGTHYWEEVSIAPVRNDAGVVEHFVSIKHDISRRKSAEAESNVLIEHLKTANTELKALNESLELAKGQLQQSEKMAAIGQLAAGVAHEINTPLGFVKSNIGTLKRYIDSLLEVVAAYADADGLLASSPTLRDAVIAARRRADLEFLQEDSQILLDESIAGIERLSGVVKNLKDFTCVDASDIQRVSLDSCLDNTLAIFGHPLGTPIEIRREYGGLPSTDCAAAQINQVFLSLLSNAVDAIDSGGIITVRTGYDDKAVWAEVEDNGKGIAPENLSRVFDPFFTTKPVGAGTGLGLSLAYGILRRHQGDISVRSDVGRGTIFRVTLPRG